MNRLPTIVSGEGSFRLDPAAVSHWSNIESVIDTVIKRLQANAPPNRHRLPPYPSSYGYSKAFPTRKGAKATIAPSLSAFHHMLAYCSYVISTMHTSQSDYGSLYENPNQVASIFEKVGNDDRKDSSHILLKQLWSTLAEIYKTRNFAGIVVTYDRAYDYRSVKDMHRYGVPVFVCWSNKSRLETYSNFPGNEHLAAWRPPVDPPASPSQPQQRPPSPHLGTPPIQRPQPPPPPIPILNKLSDRYPWQYVEARKAAIASKPNTQQWLDRQRFAQSFKEPGKSGPRVSQFLADDAADVGAGAGRRWKLVSLTRAEAQCIWSDLDPCTLW